MLSLGHKYPYERRTNDFLTIYVMVKNRSYGVRKGICDQGFMVKKSFVRRSQGYLWPRLYRCTISLSHKFYTHTHTHTHTHTQIHILTQFSDIHIDIHNYPHYALYKWSLDSSYHYQSILSLSSISRIFPTNTTPPPPPKKKEEKEQEQEDRETMKKKKIDNRLRKWRSIEELEEEDEEDR